MKLIAALQQIKMIQYLATDPPVVETAVQEFAVAFPQIKVGKIDYLGQRHPDSLLVLIADPDKLKELKLKYLKDKFIYFKIQDSGSGLLLSSHPYFLYSFVAQLLETSADQDGQAFQTGKVIVPAFHWHRTSFDYFLTQPGRIQRNLNRTSYIRELARLGFTHVEVNGLAYPMGLETGPAGETYPMFYTYCPALDQFVYSELNKGLYPYYYLSANLKYLKDNAKHAIKYGLVPGLLCFEPRSVPERFFEKYPMLRGARVDHPFRSFKPRYNMTITHPKVRAHYAEMMQKLMREVPELGFINIWTNDSGAGFEHTKSLYVGRNGGAYLIREWKDDAEIARLAGENALRYLRTLRDAASEINPEFRVITRMESFYGEHETVWNGLGNRIEIETNSLAAIGWEMPYTHPKYIDSKDINGGTIYQQQFDAKEKAAMDDLQKKGAQAHFYFAVGPFAIFDPLMGIPYPKLTYRRLQLLHQNGVDYLSHQGGIFPPEQVPYNINHEIVCRFQHDSTLDIDAVVANIARKWAGEDFNSDLLKAWSLTEEAILAFPNVVGLYTTFGFSWYRLWVRPFVPNLEAIPAAERALYENFMCTTPHNPNNVDLSRDVLFQLTTPEKSKLNVERIDQNVWQPLDQAIAVLKRVNEKALAKLGPKNVITDQWIRLQALRCWFMTQRNVAAWIAGVYGYLNAQNKTEKKRQKAFVQDLMRKEIENTRQLARLLDTDVEFMVITDKGETPLIYGENLPDLLPKRIAWMQAHMDDEPFIDQNYIERMAGEPVSSSLEQ